MTKPQIIKIDDVEYIRKDEFLEVTPKSLRLRKIVLDENERKKSQKQVESMA